MMSYSRLRLLAVALFAVLATLSAGGLRAEAVGLPAPTGPTILTVGGLVTRTNAGPVAAFDMAMLEALPGRVTETETPWTKGKARFEGPLGSALLDAVGATGTTLHVVSLDDYAVDIPVSDFRRWPVILAVKLGGKPIAVRDKGPVFIIYPFDVDPTLYNERIFSRSVWQVKAMEIR